MIIDGCESTSHDKEHCYGELWTCDDCGLSVCCADGTAAGDPKQDSLCDSCWLGSVATTSDDPFAEVHDRCCKECADD